MKTTLFTILMVVLCVVGWAGGTFLSQSRTVANIEPNVELTPEEVIILLGTKDHPLDLDTPVSLGDFTVSVSGSTQISTSEVMSFPGIRNEPLDAWEYVTTDVTVSYQGKGEGFPHEHLQVAFLGSDGVEYYDSCGPVESAWYGALGMKKGGNAVTFTTCTGVPAGVIAGGAWVLKTVFVETQESYYFKAVS